MSAVLEREIVEGRPFEPPQQSRDVELPRYITFVGSMIEATVAQERSWTRGGGMEIGNPCLRYVKYFVRKGRITPVLKDIHDWVTADYWEKATGRDASYFPRPIRAGYVAPANEFGHPSPIKPMYGKMAAPGHQMDSILNGSANVLDRTRRGVVELTEFTGTPYVVDINGGRDFIINPEISAVEKAIFPDYPLILKDGQPTVLLDDIEGMLLDAQRHTQLRSIVDKYLTSLNQFRDFARGAIEQTHARMRESAVKSDAGYIWRYTELDFVLMEQLGMQRMDREIRQNPTATPNLTELTSLIQQFVQASLEEKQLLAEQRAQGVNVNESTMAAAPIATEAEEVKMYVCEHCGEEMKLTAKGFHLGRHCKVLHPKNENEQPEG